MINTCSYLNVILVHYFRFHNKTTRKYRKCRRNSQNGTPLLLLLSLATIETDASAGRSKCGRKMYYVRVRYTEKLPMCAAEK